MARRAHSLLTLLKQVNTKYPNRDKASDGWIGDTAHAARKSDHNPDSNGIVHAIDLDEDGWPCATFVNQLVASRDPRLKYVIYERRIWYPSSGWRAYTGSNPHTLHVHISVYSGVGDQNREWNIPLLDSNVWNHNMTKDQVMTLQRVMNAWYPANINLVVDGDYGPATTSAVRYVQTRLGLTVDGMAGPITRRALSLKF